MKCDKTGDIIFGKPVPKYSLPLPMRPPPEMQLAWTEYWKTGASESMPEDRASGRLRELDETWKAFFSDLPERARVLDLATGGGDVIRQALTFGRGLTITGVDIADLSAVRASIQSGAVKLVGGTDLSRLPFPDSAFDGVASQFDFEYADVEAAATEAVRVLAPGGQACFVMHHAGSAVSHGDLSTLSAYQSVFADNDVFRYGREVFELYRRQDSTEAVAVATERFRDAVRLLQSRFRNEPAYRVVGNVIGFLTRLASDPSALPAPEGLHQLDSVEKFNIGRNLRKAAQVKAALDRRGADRVASCLRAAGAKVSEPKELRYTGGRILGWRLRFDR